MFPPRPGLTYYRLGTARFPWNLLDGAQAIMRQLRRVWL